MRIKGLALRKREGRYRQKGQNRNSLCILLILLLLPGEEALWIVCCPSPVHMQVAAGQADRIAERETIEIFWVNSRHCN